MKFLRLHGSKQAVRNRLVGFSFDDGPNKKNIFEVLKILQKHNLSATFFWIVENTRKLKQQDPVLFKKIMKLIHQGKHEIGLHAPYDYNPTLFTKIWGKFSYQELKQAKDELESITGNPINLYRPHRLLQPITVAYATQIGLTTVLGNFKSYAEADTDPEKQIKRFSQAKPGSILIFHDGIALHRQKTYITDILPAIIQNLQQLKLNPTRVSKVIKTTEPLYPRPDSNR